MSNLLATSFQTADWHERPPRIRGLNPHEVISEIHEWPMRGAGLKSGAGSQARFMKYRYRLNRRAATNRWIGDLLYGSGRKWGRVSIRLKFQLK
jgi:hypothetical protein